MENILGRRTPSPNPLPAGERAFKPVLNVDAA